MPAPATYTRDATGATGTFGVDVGYFDTGTGSGVTINFMPDTSGAGPNYKERFTGKLISATRMDGTSFLTPSNSQSQFGLADGSVVSLNRK